MFKRHTSKSQNMENNFLFKTVHNLDKTIQRYISHNAMDQEYNNLHQECIKIMLNKFDLFNDQKSRIFVSWLLWNQSDTCVNIMNKDEWKIPINSIEKEFDELKQWNNHTLFLYSIIKFIGQYTNNKELYDKCWEIILSIPINLNDVSEILIKPSQIIHLFAFNINFKHKNIPKKTRGSNRLIQFVSTGIHGHTLNVYQNKYLNEQNIIASTLCFKEFSTLPGRQESHLLHSQNKRNPIYFLYYLISTYQLFKKKINIFSDLYELCIHELPSNEYILEIMRELFLFETNAENCTSDVNQSVSDVIKNKLSLLDLTNSTSNNEEIMCIINEASTVYDIHLFKEEYYDMFRITLFKSLYEIGLIQCFDIYTQYALSLARINDIKWIENFIKDLQKKNVI